MKNYSDPCLLWAFTTLVLNRLDVAPFAPDFASKIFLSGEDIPGLA